MRKSSLSICGVFTWFPYGHNFNTKFAYSHIDPRTGNGTNEFTIQMQFFYY